MGTISATNEINNREATLCTDRAAPHITYVSGIFTKQHVGRAGWKRNNNKQQANDLDKLLRKDFLWSVVRDRRWKKT